MVGVINFVLYVFENERLKIFNTIILKFLIKKIVFVLKY